MLYKRLNNKAITPKRAHPNDAGLDLFGLEALFLQPGEIKRVRTGIAIALDPGETVLFWEKSGRCWDVSRNRPIGLGILGGCIDGPYRGELFVTVVNLNIFNLLRGLQEDGDNIFIPYGNAITQMLHFSKGSIMISTPEEYDFSADTERGTKGFGSSDPSNG